MNKDYLEGLLDGLSDATLELSNFNEYGFEYLDGYLGFNKRYFVKLEYTNNDIEYKDESDFDDIFEYEKFREKMSDKIISKRIELKNKIEKILKEYNLGIRITDLDWDEYDYPCIYLVFQLKTQR